jgi:adenylate kinase
MKIVLLGPPGSGKGTYSSRLSPIYGIPHISMGQVLREMRDDSELGPIIKEKQDKGELVPSEIVVNALMKRLEKDDCKNGYILDGYPRSSDQAEAIEGKIDVDVVLVLDLPEDIIVQKISARRNCEKCGDIYNIADIHHGDLHLPPMLPKEEGKCDKCGGALVQRQDDKEDVIRDRLKLYADKTQPLVKYYKDKGLIMDVVVTAGPDVMTKKIVDMLKERGKNV